MRITGNMLSSKLLSIAKKNAPVRIVKDKAGNRPRSRAVGKKGTNMYSPYPGNLKNNGIYKRGNAVVFDYNKVGYIGYANLYSKKPQYIEKTLNDFLNYCVSLGGRIEKR
jgi:isocitrate dehydrogenase kinase/phosphatase